MKKHLFVSGLILCIIFSACTTKCPPLTDIQKADIEKQILEEWDRITISIEKLDLENYSDFISSDAFIAMYAEAIPFQTKAEILDTLKGWFSERKSNELQQKNVKVTVLTDSLVLLDQLCIFKIILKDDSVIRAKDALSFIFKKEPAGWKIIHGHESWSQIL